MPPTAALKTTLLFQHERRQWEVAVQIMRESRSPLLLGCEPLEEFPSEVMIAQAMLVA